VALFYFVVSADRRNLFHFANCVFNCVWFATS
jgi:hypothetical protein